MKGGRYLDRNRTSCYSGFEFCGLLFCLLLSKGFLSCQFLVVVFKNTLLTLEVFCFFASFFSNSHRFFHFLTQRVLPCRQLGSLPGTVNYKQPKTFPRQKCLLLWDNRLLTEDREASTTHSLSKPEAFRINKKAFPLKFCRRQSAFHSCLWYPSTLWFTRTIFLKSIVWSPGIHFGELRWSFFDKRTKNWPQISKNDEKNFFLIELFPLICYSCYVKGNFDYCLKRVSTMRPKNFRSIAENVGNNCFSLRKACSSKCSSRHVESSSDIFAGYVSKKKPE